WCFVMEYLPEGSIRDLVRKKGPFREETARLLSAQVALAIQHVHEKGTSADWWSFGIVVFVMLVGKTPLAIYAAEKGVDLHLARRDIRYRPKPARLMRTDGSFLPFWSDLGRRIAHKLTLTPKDGRFLEQIANARGPYGVVSGLAQHQPSTFGFLVATFTLSGLMTATWLLFLALRLTGRCGGQRVQVITPLYAQLYNGYCIAMSSITVTFIIANVLLAGFAFGIQNSALEASVFYTEAFDGLERYFRTQPQRWNSSRQAARDAAFQTRRLSKDFNEEFKQHLLQKLNINPFASKGRTCGKVLRAMLSEHSDLLDADCSTLEKTQEQFLSNATENFKKNTSAERKGLIRKLRVKVAEAIGGNNSNVKHLVKVKAKLRSFNKRTHFGQIYGGLAPLIMMMLSMSIGIVAALLVMAIAMGMLNHDRGMAPTLRNSYSHKAGIIMLYSPAVMFLSSIVAVPLAGLLLPGCVVAECYICEPYLGKHRHILNDVASKLLSASPALIPIVLVAAGSVSLRLSKFYLVMDQYCYAGWDERILRRAPRRRKVSKKRRKADVAPEDKESSRSLDEQTDSDSRNNGDGHLKDLDMSSVSLGQHGDEAGPWHSESWLLGSVNGSGLSLDPPPVSEATPGIKDSSPQKTSLEDVKNPLLQKQDNDNPKRRLGCRPEGGFDELMKNPFYAPIDWSEVSCGSLPSTTREEGSNLST
ncbi:serine/threonine protein kinase, putative, partial [Ixodes scapularis]